MSLDVRLPDSSANRATTPAATGAAAGTGAVAGFALDPALNFDLASNNPFRNRAATPSTPPTDPSLSPTNPFFPRTTTTIENATIHNQNNTNTNINGGPLYYPQRDSAAGQSRPVSRNPFLEASATMDGAVARPQAHSPRAAPLMAGGSFADRAANELKRLELNSDSRGNAENLPPRSSEGREGSSTAGHRMTRSQEEGKGPYRAADMSSPTGPARSSRVPNAYDGSADSARGQTDRPARRNSESSIAEVRAGGGADADKEKQRERRPPRERRHRDGRPRKPNHKLDVIDKLDVTSIYGTVFHHDGPFDACNPHRNRKGSSRAPMQAFAKDSANNVLGGSGPVHKDIDRVQYMGDRGAEAFSDFSQTRAVASEADEYDRRYARPKVDRTPAFDPVARVDPVHGDESLGLGTSTFLEGAPASRTAIQRRQSEGESSLQGGGMSRKKSLVKKIRGLNPSRQYGGGGGGLAGRNGSIDLKQDVIHAAGPMSPGTTRDASGPMTAPSGSHGPHERNPFFSEFDGEDGHDHDDEKKTHARVSVTEQAVPAAAGHTRQPSSPRRGLERSMTHDSAAIKEEPAETKPSGFLSRVRSLRGGRRPRAGERGY